MFLYDLITFVTPFGISLPYRRIVQIHRSYNLLWSSYGFGCAAFTIPRGLVISVA